MIFQEPSAALTPSSLSVNRFPRRYSFTRPDEVCQRAADARVNA